MGKAVEGVMKKIPGTKAYRVIKQERARKRERGSKRRSETKMRQVLYNYSTVFENYISFLLIELNNGTRLHDLDYSFSGQHQPVLVTNFLRWLSDINNPLSQGGLGSLIATVDVFDDDGSPLTQSDRRGILRPLPGNRAAYLHLLKAARDRVIENNIDNNIELMKIGNKKNMIDTLFPQSTYDPPYVGVPVTDLYKTTVNNIDLYIGDERHQTLQQPLLAGGPLQSVVAELQQIKQIEFLRYLVYNRIKRENGDYKLDNAGNFTYNPPLVTFGNPPWTNFLVQGGGLTKQKQKGTKRRRNKKKKTRRKKKRRRKKTIKKRRKRKKLGEEEERKTRKR